MVWEDDKKKWEWEKEKNNKGGRSGEYWKMGERMIKKWRVSDEGNRVVKIFKRWR